MNRDAVEPAEFGLGETLNHAGRIRRNGDYQMQTQHIISHDGSLRDRVPMFVLGINTALLYIRVM
jgi:hypothetical protein